MSTQKRAVIYARISLDQTGEGKGVARQVEACEALAQARGWQVVGVEEDNSVSAFKKRAKRPAWERVLGMVERGDVDVVLAWALDRITRSMVDLEALIVMAEKHGVAIATVTGDLDLTTDTGRMLARILGAVARGEVERKGARQKAAYRQAAEDGKPHWAHRPFGLTRDGDLEPVEAALGSEVYRRVLDGASLHSTAQWLNLQPGGIPERERKVDGVLVKKPGEYRAPWSGQSLGRWIRDARNAGIRTHNGQEVGDGNWEAIVPETTWRAALALLGQPGRRVSPQTDCSKRLYALTGLATCGECASRIKGGTMARTGRYKGLPTYSCPNGHISLPVEWVDGRVFLALSELLDDPDRREDWRHLSDDAQEELALLRVEADQIEADMAQAGRDLADGLLERAVVVGQMTRYRERMSAVEERRKALGMGAVVSLSGDVEAVMERLDTMDLEPYRALLSSHVEAIVLHRRGKGSRAGLTEDLVTITPRSLDVSDWKALA